MSHLCDYGCGQEAQHQLKNGKWCCSISCNGCPQIKKKNSESVKYALIRKGWRPKPAPIRKPNLGIASTPEKESERRKRISETMRKNKLCGGYRPGSGKAIKGWYKGYWCDSSWELAYTIYNIDHNIKFERNRKCFIYHNQEGNEVKYYPDYILPDGTFVEIKGRDSYQDWLLKLNEFPKDIKLVVYNYWGMKPFLKYVISKYGKKFTNLYETSNYKK